MLHVWYKAVSVAIAVQVARDNETVLAMKAALLLVNETLGACLISHMVISDPVTITEKSAVRQEFSPG